MRPQKEKMQGDLKVERHRRGPNARQQVVRLPFVQKPVRFLRILPTREPSVTGLLACGQAWYCETGEVFGHGRSRWNDNNRPRRTTRQQAREFDSGAGVVYRGGLESVRSLPVQEQGLDHRSGQPVLMRTGATCLYA